VCTFLATKITLAYTTLPFVTLSFNPGFFIYTRLYFFMHILALFSILVLPRIMRPLSSKGAPSIKSTNSTSNGKYKSEVADLLTSAEEKKRD